MSRDISDARFKRITVFTPTYNRSYILNNLYESLKRQSFKDFEWLIVDDGSTDGTEELLNRWQLENLSFPLRYYRQENGGKHRAVNYGLNLAEGEIFFVVDSDEYLTDDALELINRWFITAEKDHSIVAVAGNKGYSKTETTNCFFEEKYLDKSFLDMSTYLEKGSHVLDGERAIAFYTDFHRKYQYPVYDGEKFMTEAVVYNRMAHDGYKVRFYNDILCIYEYLDDGLTKSGSCLFLQNPKGYALWLREKTEFRGASFIDRLKMNYMLCVELCPLYDKKTVAECLQIRYFSVITLYLLYRLKHPKG